MSNEGNNDRRKDRFGNKNAEKNDREQGKSRSRVKRETQRSKYLLEQSHVPVVKCTHSRHHSDRLPTEDSAPLHSHGCHRVQHQRIRRH